MRYVPLRQGCFGLPHYPWHIVRPIEQLPSRQSKLWDRLNPRPYVGIEFALLGLDFRRVTHELVVNSQLLRVVIFNHALSFDGR